jgi:beta-lactamase superfamily II metal-dependent hydrolase
LCAVAASIAAVTATLPFVWSRLAEWSPWGILATPVLGPPMAALLGLGWLRVFCGPMLVPDSLLVPFARATTASMRAFDLLPFTPAPLPPRPMWLVALACVATMLCVGRVWTRASARLAAVAWAALLLPWRATAARVEIHALDVGAGTAVVIEGPGLGTWVFDAGSRDRPDVAREALGPLLRRMDPGPLGIVLSHSDRDHDAALPWLVERFPPRVFAGALPAHIGERLPHGTAAIDLATGRAWLPMLAGGAPGVGLVLERGLDVEGNEGSRVLRVHAGNEEALLCGDAEEEGLRAWLRANSAHAGSVRPVRLVLWPHHGSDMDLIEPFLRAIRPAQVWISASGVPPVHADLARRAIVTQCTALCGPLHATLGGNGMLPAPSAGSAPRDGGEMR